MATLSAINLSFRHDNGDQLFNQISFTLRHRLTAIVGANGTGKSVLGRCLCGQLTPDSGFIRKEGILQYVPQSAPIDCQLSVSRLFGLDRALNAALRIEQGSQHMDDIYQAQIWWEQSAVMNERLRNVGFQDLIDLQRPLSTFSGGEQFRLMWAKALMAEPDLFVFDEPTNHLDTEGRRLFFDWLSDERRPSLLISHDRDVLSRVDSILELTHSQMHVHPGSYQAYIDERHHRRVQQEEAIAEATREKRKRDNKAQAAVEKQQQRASRGRQHADRTGLDKLLRDGMKQAAENSLHQQKKLRQNRRSLAGQQLDSAKEKVEWQHPIDIRLPDSAVPDRKIVLTSNALSSGIEMANHTPFTVELRGAFRLRLEGSNGVGKSVLLKTLLGEIPCLSGRFDLRVPVAYLDQHFTGFDDSKSALDNLLSVHPALTAHEGHAQLAQVRLRNSKADVAFGKLSGGEQLKAALAIALLAPRTPQLLLLDEPTNHLDLDSTLALEQALKEFQGAMIVVSHDDRFVESLGLTHRLILPEGALSEITD